MSTETQEHGYWVIDEDGRRRRQAAIDDLNDYYGIGTKHLDPKPKRYFADDVEDAFQQQVSLNRD